MADGSNPADGGRPGSDDGAGGDRSGRDRSDERDTVGNGDRSGREPANRGGPGGDVPANARLGARSVAVVGLAVDALRYERLRSTAAIVGVALAVVSIVLLGGAGAGVLETGQSQFDAADRDLWITGESVGLTTAGGGGLEPTIQDAHTLSAALEGRDDVRNAVPMGFQTLYVGTEPDELDTVVASGVPGGGSSVSIEAGSGFTGSDTHYANGTYEGPRTGQAIVDGRMAERLNLSVGDTIYVGGSIASARETTYEVVGVSDTFASFLGTSTVTIRLSELQSLTGGAGTDDATLLTVTVADGADPEAVERAIESEYPEYEVRTNDEQLRAIVGDQAAVLVGAGVLVVLAVVTGAALSITLFALSVYQHRRAYRTLAAIGVSRRTIVGVVAIRGLLLGVLGWLVGAALSVPAIRGLNAVVSWVVGYDGLVVATPLAVAVAAVVAIGIGTLAATVAAWRLPRVA
ncbi:ABC transporter permease [Halovivax cerinus]|uniref:ABC transporter permease n=1 Tax=Halovivax cerinus TaxID=1487865 RepID=A0ABD5NQ97_9EURY|nr:ABC transporter permease [Halovivax cerinus]